MANQSFLFVVALALLACGAPDEGNGQTKELLSEAKRFKATFEPHPSDPQVGENRLDVSLRTSDEAPVTSANLEIDGEMTAHGHGLGTTPTTTEHGDGLYSIGPIVYTMPGVWQLVVHIATHETSDSFSLDYDVR